MTDRPRTLGEWATSYAARGLPVFPLVPRGKEPMVPGGFRSATTKAHIIGAWWTQWPTANIGCPPGAAGFTVFDLDGPEGETAAGRLGLLAEPTLEVVTGRADGGRHRWYRHPGFRVSNRALASKLDIRSDDGYVILPPSVHPSGRVYGWRGRFEDVAVLPPAVVALLREHSEPASGEPVPSIIAPGQRNVTLFRLACAWRRLGAAEPIILAGLQGANRVGCRPPLDERELAAIAKSAERYPPQPSPEAQAKPAPVTRRPTTGARRSGPDGRLVRRR